MMVDIYEDIWFNAGIFVFGMFACAGGIDVVNHIQPHAFIWIRWIIFSLTHTYTHIRSFRMNWTIIRNDRISLLVNDGWHLNEMLLCIFRTIPYILLVSVTWHLSLSFSIINLFSLRESTHWLWEILNINDSVQSGDTCSNGYLDHLTFTDFNISYFVVFFACFTEERKTN